MRKIASTYILSSDFTFVKNAILRCNGDGSFFDFIQSDEPLHEQAGMEFYSGILVPGFVQMFNFSDVQNLTKRHKSFSDFKKEYLNLAFAEKGKPVFSTDKKQWMSGISYTSKQSDYQYKPIEILLLFQSKFPDEPLENLILLLSSDSAKAIRIDNVLGSFEKGKNPGVNLLTGIDFKTMKLTENAKVKRLI